MFTCLYVHSSIQSDMLPDCLLSFHCWCGVGQAQAAVQWSSSRCPALSCPVALPQQSALSQVSMNFSFFSSLCDVQLLLSTPSYCRQFIATHWQLRPPWWTSICSPRRGLASQLWLIKRREEEGPRGQIDSKVTPLIIFSLASCCKLAPLEDVIKSRRGSTQTPTHPAEPRSERLYLYFKGPHEGEAFLMRSTISLLPRVSIIPSWYKTPHPRRCSSLEGLPNFIKAPSGSCLTCPQAINSPSPLMLLQPKLPLITRQRWITDKALRSLTDISFPLYIGVSKREM